MGANVRNAKLYEFMGGRDTEVGSLGIKRSLQVLRGHLGMDVVYLSRFDNETWTLREFDSSASDCGLFVGQTLPRNATYCGNVAAGRLPAVIPDTAANALASGLRVTRMLTIGSHVGTPVMLDGQVWGMLCCYAFNKDLSLNERDLALVESFAEVLACELKREVEACAQAKASIERVTSVLGDEVDMIALLQPIWDLARGSRWGAEALVRIADDPSRGPSVWFAEAASVSLREELELAALKKAIASLAHLDPATIISLNVSPKTVLSGAFRGVVADVQPDRILLELAEHLPVDDYDALRAALAPLRGSGMRVAVDDAGGGYASMTHILQLRPDVIKADMALTRDIDSDRAKQALLSALVGFGRSTRARMLAKGIETAGELAQLKRLGVELGQGYLLGRPARPQDIDDAFAAGAAAFRPALVHSREWVDAISAEEMAEGPDARRRFAAAIDPRAGRFVV